LVRNTELILRIERAEKGLTSHIRSRDFTYIRKSDAVLRIDEKALVSLSTRTSLSMTLGNVCGAKILANGYKQKALPAPIPQKAPFLLVFLKNKALRLRR